MKTRLDLPRLRTLLAEDETVAGYLPTDEQCYFFICGGDDGEIPPDLVRDFPRTHAYLDESWQ